MEHQLHKVFNGIVFLAVLFQKNEKRDNMKPLGPWTPRTFDDLMSHEAELLPNPAVRQLYSHLRPYIALLDKTGEICPDYATFVRLYGRFHTNAFTISDYFAGDVGKGLYLGPSVLDHSCDNNAIQAFIGKQLVIKAIRDINKSSDVSEILKKYSWCRSVLWSVDWLIAWLTCRLIDWLCHCRLIDWSIDCSIVPLSIDWLIDWLFDCAIVDWLIDWSIDWLVGWLFFISGSDRIWVHVQCRSRPAGLFGASVFLHMQLWSLQWSAAGTVWEMRLLLETMICCFDRWGETLSFLSSSHHHHLLHHHNRPPPTSTLHLISSSTLDPDVLLHNPDHQSTFPISFRPYSEHLPGRFPVNQKNPQSNYKFFEIC